jgi:hypothetical protein
LSDCSNSWPERGEILNFDKAYRVLTNHYIRLRSWGFIEVTNIWRLLLGVTL